MRTEKIGRKGREKIITGQEHFSNVLVAEIDSERKSGEDVWCELKVCKNWAILVHDNENPGREQGGGISLQREVCRWSQSWSCLQA